LQTRINTLIKLALEEDAAFGDVTSQSIFPVDHISEARILARQDMVVCGLDVAKQVFKRVDPAVKLEINFEDGDWIASGRTVMTAKGSTISLMIAERTALNFLQRLSGIACLARLYASAVTNTDVRVVDTRKTTPGWRALEKYAVICGGCFNHRASLSEHALIKENHIMAAGSLGKAVQLVRTRAPDCEKIEVETENMEDVIEALEAKADVIMLDNMSPAEILRAVESINGAAIIEVSGGITLESIADYALPGVDIISVGALTHSATAADFSMILDKQSDQ
jgi:nicotinate-nucleotide pyrophosphorylase (carboxylating)